LEKDGSAFYTRLAEKVTHSSLKALFMKLAIEERSHQRTLENLFQTLNQSPKDLLTEIPSDLVDWKRLSEEVSAISEQEQDLEKELPSNSQMLQLAIQSEKSVVELLEAAIQIVLDYKSKELLKALVEEEKKHLRELEELTQTVVD